MAEPGTLLPYLYFAPLHRGSLVLAFSGRDAVTERGLLDVEIRRYRPDEPAPPAVEVLVADVRDEDSLEAARRAAAAMPPTTAIVLLDWRGGGPAERWRRLRGSAPRLPFELSGREVRWEFVLEPSLDRPRDLVRPGDRAAIPAEYGAPWRRALKRAGLFFLQRRHRAVVLAPGAAGSVVEDALAEVLQGPATVRRVYVSDTETMVVAADAGDRRAFLRFPLSERALARVARSHRLETLLRERGIALAPEPLAMREGGLCPFHAESGASGRTATDERLLGAALAAIRSVHEAFGRVLTMDEAHFEGYVEKRLRTVEAAAGRSLGEVRPRLREALLGRRVLVSLCHGDYKLGNCLFEGERVTGIVDWDMGSEEDLALVDVGNLHGKAIQDRGDLALWQAALADPGDLFGTAYAEWFAATETDMLPPRATLLAWWLDRAYKQLRFGTDPDRKWTRHHVLPLCQAHPLSVA